MRAPTPDRSGVDTAAIERALDVLGACAQRDVPLAPLTTYRVGGAADVFVTARSLDDLALVRRALAVSGLPVLIVGRGSNLLVHDEGFHGIAVSVAPLAGDITIGDATSGAQTIVEAGSAVLLPVLARKTVAAGLTGFEWAVGVPGSIGGAVRMNAGGHGSDMAASLVDVRIADLTADDSTEVVSTVGADALGLRFRGSGLPPTSVVLAARLALAPGNREDGERELSEIVAWRREHQPGGQNAGSVFVNPVPGEVSAGALVDGVGLRGFRLGSATVSDKHANFIQADDGGTSADVVALMRHVRERVLAETGYALRSEIRLIGFEDTWA